MQLDLDLEFFKRIVFLKDYSFYIIETRRSWIFFDLEVSGEVEIPLPYAEEYICKMISELESLLETPYENTNGYFLVEYSELHRRVPIDTLYGEKAIRDLKAFLAFIKDKKEG